MERDKRIDNLPAYLKDENGDIDDNVSRVSNWLLRFGNFKAIDQITNDPANARFRNLVREVNANPTFQAINEEELLDNRATDFNWLGHNGLEKAHEKRYRDMAEHMEGAQGWVRALKTFRLGGPVRRGVLQVLTAMRGK